MKTIFFLTLSLLIFSCAQKTANEDKELPEFLKDVYVTDNTEIIGSWSMCSTSENGMLMQYNVCPTVSFLNSGSGLVKNSGALSERFNWTMRNGVLNIIFGKNIPNSIFPDTLYSAIINKQNLRMNLIISQSKKGKIFYLSK